MEISFAHVAGLPLEELLLPLVSSAGALWLALRAWVQQRVRSGGRR